MGLEESHTMFFIENGDDGAYSLFTKFVENVVLQHHLSTDLHQSEIQVFSYKKYVTHEIWCNSMQ